MKKVASIFAVALMAVGMTTYAIENNTNEIDFMQDLNSMLACDDCAQNTDDRGSES